MTETVQGTILTKGNDFGWAVKLNDKEVHGRIVGRTIDGAKADCQRWAAHTGVTVDIQGTVASADLWTQWAPEYAS